MATVSERHPGGRPRVRQPSELFLRVQKLAATKGMHLDDLAQKAGIPIGTVYDLRDPRVSTAQAIASALGVTIDRLLASPKRSARRTA